MQSKLEDGAKNVERVLTVSIPANEIDTEVENKIIEFSKKAHLRGFRPGKASVRMVRQQYGKAFRQDVLGEAINKYYAEVLKEHKVNPINMPKVDIMTDIAGKDIEFKATFEVIPEIEVKGLDNIKLEKVTSGITDKDLEEVINRLQKQHATFKDVKRAAKNDDTIEIDFEGFVDGKTFEGGSAKNNPLTLGSKQMIEGFEDGLVGAKVGEERELKLKFPEDYHVKDLAGKDTTFNVKVNKVQEPELPEINDDFAAKFSVLTVDDLKKEVRSNMERELDFKLKNIVKDQIIEALLKDNEVDVPQSLVHQEIQNLKYQASARFGLLDDKGEMKGNLPDEMFKEEAEKRCKLGVMMSSLVTHFKVKPDSARIEEALDKFASIYEDKDEIKREYKKDPSKMEQFIQQVVEDMVIEKIIEGAKITEKKKKFFDVIDANALA